MGSCSPAPLPVVASSAVANADADLHTIIRKMQVSDAMLMRPAASVSHRDDSFSVLGPLGYMIVGGMLFGGD